MISHILPSHFHLVKNQKLHFFTGENYEHFLQVEGEIYIPQMPSFEITKEIVEKLQGKDLIVTLPECETDELLNYRIYEFQKMGVHKIAQNIEGTSSNFLRLSFLKIQENTQVQVIGIPLNVFAYCDSRNAFLALMNGILSQKRAQNPNYRYKRVHLIDLKHPFIDDIWQMGLYSKRWDISASSSCLWDYSVRGIFFNPQKGAQVQVNRVYRSNQLWNAMAWVWNKFVMEEWLQNKKPDFNKWGKNKMEELI